jgi:hypothetical protein
MSRYRLFSGFVIWVATILLLSGPLLGDVTGTIRGTVTDPTGAVIAGATVRLHNALTGLQRLATSDSTGAYEFLALPVGNGYEVSVDAKGFKAAVLADMELLVNQVYRADFRLRVGSVTEKVEVTAAPVQVEAGSTQVGDVISDTKMVALPLNGRSYVDLLGLQAGVIPTQTVISMGLVNSAPGGLFSGSLSVSGAREDANEFVLNGLETEDPHGNTAAVIPSLDSIQEFRVITSTDDAEYGRYQGAIVNVVTKAGTNQLHGTVYEFLRNNALDSRNFFNYNATDPLTGQELPGTAIGALKQSMFGFAIGGPIRKNRLFFFSDYQGTRNVTGVSTGVIDVPSALERTGDFSDVDVTHYASLTNTVRGANAPGLNSMPEVLTQRLGYTVTGGEPYWVSGCNTLADAQAGMCVFPGQIIPQNAWGPVAKATLKYFAAPTGFLNGTPFFSTSANKDTLTDDKFGQRVDLNTQSWGSWAMYYNYDKSGEFNPYQGGNMGGFGGTSPYGSQNASLTNTRSFGSSSVNEVRLGYTRFFSGGSLPTQGLGKITDFGFTEGGQGIIPALAKFEGLPPIGLAQLGDQIGITYSSIQQWDDNFQAQEHYSRVIGRHTLKLGGEFTDYEVAELYIAATNGSFQFYGDETGNDFADYLLGAPDAFAQGSGGALDGRAKHVGLYANDSFKLRPNFTLNYGLRWEVSNPWSDTQGRLDTFNPGEQSTRYPDAPTGWDFPGDPGVPWSVAPTKYHDFAPRLGIAFSPSTAQGPFGRLFGGPGRTSVRAAFGIYFQPFYQMVNYYITANAPFAQSYSSPVPVYMETPYVSRIQGTNLPQKFPWYPEPAGSTGFWAQYQPISGAGGYNRVDTTPYSEQYNFNIQRQIGNSAILSIGYVGSEGHHLMTQVEGNIANRAECLQIAALEVAQGQPGEACGPFGEDTIYNISPGVTYYGTREYSVTSGRYLSQGLLDFGAIQNMITLANSNYDALQVSLEKRAGPLRLLAAYTWSKSMDDSSGFIDGPGSQSEGINPYNNRLSYVPSAFNMPQNFVVSYVYDLPFQKTLQSHQGPLYKFLDGWQISGITRFTMGPPVSLSESDDMSLCNCFGVGVPNWNGQQPQIFNPRKSVGNQYFSTQQFSEVNLGQLGTSAYRFFGGPGLNNWDLALHKQTKISERLGVEVRAELFNAFNHAQFNSPGGIINSSTFGQVTSAGSPRIGQVALKLTF